MSKYTTEVRFICESITGHTSSVGFNDVKNVLADAAPLIFDFDYPIFDENYRIPLETKILRHYYTREICEETYGLWKLRLEDRMNVIMPYYNKLYESELLKFDPFRDVDLTTTHTGSNSGVVNESGSTNETRDNEREGNIDENASETNVKSGNNEKNNVENTNKTGNETSGENFIKSGSNSGEENVNESTENSHTGDVSDSVNRQHNVVNISNESGNSTENRVGNKDEDYSGNNAQNNVSSSNGNRENETSDLQWDLFSDTPQGGIDGLNIPNASAPSATLENNLYLTTARKISDNTKSKESNDNVMVENNNGEQNSITHQTEINNNSIESNNAREGSESGNVEESAVKTYNEGNSESKSGSKNSVGSFNEINSGNIEKEHEESGSLEGRSNEIYNELNNNNSNKGVNERNKENEKMNRERSETRVSNTTDEYLQNIAGKSGGMSYSSMMLEFRETFINIDEMIIEELTDLFFGLWK